MASAVATQDELRTNKVPLGWRDSCSAMLIPLNVCRRKTGYLPWECETERHGYEECQYKDYLRRMSELSKQKLAAAEEE